MKASIKNGLILFCLTVFIAVAPTVHAGEKDKEPKLNDWQIGDTNLQDQIDDIEQIPGPEGPPGPEGSAYFNNEAPTVTDDINSPEAYSIGTIWIDTTNNDVYILVDSTPNAAVWKLFLKPHTYAIGDEGPAGGIVFYVTDMGLHGMEAALEDQGVARWGCESLEIDGAVDTAIGTGSQNTADILADCLEYDIAAKLASGYTLNDFTDWFLPSKDELIELYENQGVVGGFDRLRYWSSSKSEAFIPYRSWLMYFLVCDCNVDGIFGRHGLLGVRAVRAF